MGLFGGVKKLCPICGNPVSWFLPTKVEGQPLCDGCGGKIFQVPDNLRSGVTESMEKVREYLAVYDENQILRDRFQETLQRTFGLFGGSISLDVPNRLLRLGNDEQAFVYGSDDLRCFRILEDSAPLFEGTKDGLVCYQSDVPSRTQTLGPAIDRYRMEERQYEQMQRMEEMMEQQAKERGKTYIKQYIVRPDINDLRPIRKFYLHIELNHMYSKGEAEYKEDAPNMSDYFGSAIKDFLKDYEAQTGELYELAKGLMQIINPDAPERQVASTASVERTSPSASGEPVDAVAEIQRYKTLLDSGAITEEEFTAKKRQLLGI